MLTNLQEDVFKYVLSPSMEMIQPLLGTAIHHQLTVLMALVMIT